MDSLLDPLSGIGLPPSHPEEERLYHQDQINRCARWVPRSVRLDELDLFAPTGSDHGPILVLPVSNVPVSGWGLIREAQARGDEAVSVFAGQGLRAGWEPRSAAEQFNAQLFSLVKKQTLTRLVEEGSFHLQLMAWLDDPRSNPNATNATGLSVLGALVGLVPPQGSVSSTQFLEWAIRAGASPNRPYLRSTSEASQGITLAGHLLPQFHVSSETLDPEAPLPHDLAHLLMLPAFDWSTPQNKAAMDHFFSRCRPTVGYKVGAESLHQFWRKFQLNQTLPTPAARPKPRF